MKKRLILIILLVIITGACFIPVTSQRTMLINADFFNTFQQLAQANNWGKWRTDLRETWLADSSKISTSGSRQNFTISHGPVTLNVQNIDGYSFNVQEINGGGALDYQYTVVPQNVPMHTKLIVTEKKSAIRYLIGRDDLSDTHVADLKKFMETPDLYYGFPIRKIQVTDTCMIGLTKTVLATGKFNEAKAMLNTIRQFTAANHLQQTQPFIAQFLPGRADSVRIKIGLPVNKKVPIQAPFLFMTMPAGGHFYTIMYRGKFNERLRAYSSLYHYYHDKGLQLPLLPFDTFLDNKLPDSDTSKVNLRINFTTF